MSLFNPFNGIQCFKTSLNPKRRYGQTTFTVPRSTVTKINIPYKG